MPHVGKIYRISFPHLALDGRDPPKAVERVMFSLSPVIASPLTSERGNSWNLK